MDARGRQLFADHLRKEFAGRRRCLAVRQIRAPNDKRGSIGCDAPHAAGCEAGINGGCLYCRHVFLKCAASRGVRKSALTEVVPARRRPRWSAPVRRRATPKRLRDVDCAMRTQPRQDLQRQTCKAFRNRWGEGRVPARIDCGGLNVPRQPRPAECCAILGYEFTGVKVSGCGTGHMHCGGQTGR